MIFSDGKDSLIVNSETSNMNRYTTMIEGLVRANVDVKKKSQPQTDKDFG